MTKPTWDIARESFTCGSCPEVIGQGEAFRVSRVPNRPGLCEACSIALDDEAAPAFIQPRTFLDRLHAEISHHRLGQQPAGRPLVMKPGSQPTVEPRGQRQNRHGIASAMRATIDADWRRRASGEREE